MHGVHHGTTTALTATHLCLQPRVDLHTVAPGFLSRAEVPENVDVEQLIADFSVATNAIAMVVSVEHDIKDTPH